MVRRLLLLALLGLAPLAQAQLGVPLPLPQSAPAAPPQGAPGSSEPGRAEHRGRSLKAWIPADDLAKKNRWEQTYKDLPLPWIAPGKRVEAFRHRHYYDEYGDREEVRWHVGDRLAYPKYAYDYPISDFVLADPVSREWKFAGETMSRPHESGSRDLILSPYRLYLVAVEPTVVVLVPYQNPPQPPYSWNNKARKRLSAEDVAIDHSDIRYGTEMPAPDGVMWLSPDEKIQARPLTFDAQGVAQFDAGVHRFKCAKAGGRMACTREAAPK